VRIQSCCICGIHRSSDFGNPMPSMRFFKREECRGRRGVLTVDDWVQQISQALHVRSEDANNEVLQCDRTSLEAGAWRSVIGTDRR